jgi:hypothetical protein
VINIRCNAHEKGKRSQQMLFKLTDFHERETLKLM